MPSMLPQFVSVIETPEVDVFLNTMTLKKVYLDKALSARLRDGTLSDTQITRLRPVMRIDSTGTVAETRIGYAGELAVNNLRLLITNRCNSGCRYCQIIKNIPDKREVGSMSAEVVNASLRKFESLSAGAKSRTVTITGGEPMLVPKVVSHIVTTVRAKWNSCRIVLFTNGTNARPEIAEELRDHRVNVLVSLDGRKAQHDRARQLLRGGDSFETALTGFNTYKTARCNVGISAVVGRHNVEDIEECILYLQSLGPASIGLNYCHLLTGGNSGLELPMDEYVDAIERVYRVQGTTKIVIEQISRVLVGLIKEEANYVQCQAAGRGITVDWQGNVGPCKTLLTLGKGSGVVGNLADPSLDIARSEIMRRWAQRSPVLIDDCKGCLCVSLCGGGCGYDAYVQGGDPFKPDLRTCIMYRRITKMLLIDIYNMLGGRQRLAAENGILVPDQTEMLSHYGSYVNEGNELTFSVGHAEKR